MVVYRRIVPFQHEKLEILPPEKLSNSDKVVPYIFAANGAFPLKTYLLKPYAFRDQSSLERIYSCRLSHPRRFVESGFSILANKFRVFLALITNLLQR